MRSSLRALVFLFVASGCAATPGTPDEPTPEEVVPVECHHDGDGDGFGYPEVTLDPDGACDPPLQTEDATDCDDSRADFNPGATDVPGDGFDQDCSGADVAYCYVDDDGDGFGGASVLDPDGNCSDEGQSAFGLDCDDSDPDAWPFAVEVPDDGIDQSCNGSDGVTCFYDGDSDGFGWNAPDGAGFVDDDGACGDDLNDAPQAGDCDDSRASFYPGAPEVPGDGFDQDCSGADLVGCYEDLDGDGQGSTNEVADTDGDCLDAGQSFVATDCDDGSSDVYLGALEVPDDGVDDDCDGVDAAACFFDGDGDGFGAAGSFQLELDGDCEDDPFDSPVDSDCNDAVASIHPGGTEIEGDGYDQDCNGFDSGFCYVDGDLDGAGAGAAVPSDDGDCVDPGESLLGTDCDDTDATRFPFALETPGDGVDQDCNGVDAVFCYYDGDGDGVGSTVTVVELDGDCLDDATDSNLGNDCDDASPSIFPGALELAQDGLDQDCNGIDATLCYADLDGDGFGAGASFIVLSGACTGGGTSALGTDCQDGEPSAFPGGLEVAWDGVDQDCNGADAAPCFYDGDGDGHGSTTPLVELDGDCADDPNDSASADDCNDASAGIYPGATEVPLDGYDQDCSGTDAALCYADVDADGFGAGALVVVAEGSCGGGGLAVLGTDCDDGDVSRYPSALDLAADGIDQDCNGVDAANCYFDGDGDGFGWEGTFVDPDGSCLDSLTDSPLGTDCDDSLATVNPAAAEVLGDGIDQDCSGIAE